MNARRLFPVLCLAAAFVAAGPALADGGRGPGPDGQGRGPQAGPPRAAPPPQAVVAPRRRSDSLADSVRRVQSHTGGQVLSAERVPFDGRDLNRVKVVDDRGRVRVYMDDPSARPRRPPRPTRGDDD